MSPKKKGAEKLIQRNPILQLDFDNLDGYDIRELQTEIFSLPFVAFIGKSFSGRGLFALILIQEPEKLKEYAEHCFNVFKSYGLPVDTSKGRNYSDLRFVSYDSNMLFRKDPNPLYIKRFNTPAVPLKHQHSKNKPFKSKNGLLSWAIREIAHAQIGQRFETVRRVAYGLGCQGYGLDEINEAIIINGQYSDKRLKTLDDAKKAFEAGLKNKSA